MDSKEKDSTVTQTKSEIKGKSLENLVQSQKLTSEKEENKVKPEEKITLCPQDFVRVGSACYYISLAKVKMRKQSQAILQSQMGWQN